MDTGFVDFNEVKERIIELRGKNVIIDSDVALLYGVETREINQAVRNNPEKFPQGYILEPDKKEFEDLRSNFLIANYSPKSRSIPKAFTEKGLYMLATILKGDKAVKTTIAIIEAFSQIRELSRTIEELSAATDKYSQKSLMEKSGGIISDLLGDAMHTNETETEIELNFAVLKLKHTVKRTK